MGSRIRGRRLGLAIGVWLVAWVALSTLSASADGPIRVELYVQFEDGSTFTQCVELDGPEATGLDLLRQSELGPIFEVGGALGTTICKIGQTGCDYPGEDCFCQCLGTPCQYWTYWYEEEGQWQYSPLSASNRTVEDGDVEGWVWGSGQESPPVEVLAEGICAAPATATPIPLEETGEDSTLPPTRTPTAPTPARTVSKVEPETTSMPSPSETPLANKTDVPTPLPPGPSGALIGSGSPVFVLLIVGLSGLGIVLLGLAYFVTHRRA